ncbi:MAG: HD domain-containing protein [Pirellulaceae bacterium]|nr:HD domain-containing protein [Pirellulaceae bacterium]
MNQTDISLMLEAVSFAARKHAGQLRKDNSTPYVAHPFRVMTILATVFHVTDPEVLAAAALHDTIEDTATDRDELIERFGTRVADMVAALSKDKRKPDSEREREYFETLCVAPIEVRLCKLADLYDNLTDAATLHSSSRGKTIAKAQQALELFSPGFPDEYRWALDCFEQRLKVAIGSL